MFFLYLYSYRFLNFLKQVKEKELYLRILEYCSPQVLGALPGQSLRG